MTTEELLALPEDGVHRELINGKLREHPMIAHGGPHCLATGNLAGPLGMWRQSTPPPRGQVYVSDAPVRIRRDPDVFVGVDLLCLSPEQSARTPRDAMFIDEPPVLIIEILSPNDTAEAIAEKVHAYIAGGVPHVWEVNPFYESDLVHRPGALPLLFAGDQELTAEPHLPGLRIITAEIFAG
jgi:Uma2 family endonuclease